MAIHIADPETTALVRRLAGARSISQTMAIRDAVIAALKALGLSTDIEQQKGPRGLKARLAERLRRETKDYVRLRETVLGQKSGSRMYSMLRRHDPVEVLRRLMASGPSDGLKFLAEHDRLEIATETAALDPEFQSIIPADVRAGARANLAFARTMVAQRVRADRAGRISQLVKRAYGYEDGEDLAYNLIEQGVIGPDVTDEVAARIVAQHTSRRDAPAPGAPPGEPRNGSASAQAGRRAGE